MESGKWQVKCYFIRWKWKLLTKLELSSWKGWAHCKRLSNWAEDWVCLPADTIASLYLRHYSRIHRMGIIIAPQYPFSIRRPCLLTWQMSMLQWQLEDFICSTFQFLLQLQLQLQLDLNFSPFTHILNAQNMLKGLLQGWRSWEAMGRIGKHFCSNLICFP